MKYVGVFTFLISRYGIKVALVKKNTPGLPLLHGRWNGIGGKMDIGESPVSAAMREFKEETGLTILKDNMVFVEHQRFIGGIAQGSEIYWYATRRIPNGDWYLPCVNDVGEELAWVSIHNGRAETGWDESLLAPNLDYLIPKAITFLRTPYLDRPC